MWIIRREFKEVEVVASEVKGVGWTHDTRISSKQVGLTMAIDNTAFA